MIEKVANMKINKVINDSNGANTSDIQVQFAGDPSGISHKNVLSSRNIGIRHEEVPVLPPPTETSIGANNQTDFNLSTGVVQASQALKTTAMQEFVAETDLYNTRANRTPQ